MAFVDESLAKGLVKRIFRSLYKAEQVYAINDINTSHRKQCNKSRNKCKTKNTAVFIAERYAETSKWQLIWGEWTLFNDKASFNLGTDPLEDYDKIAFDLTFQVRGGYSYKTYYIVLTKHALIRLIMRCQESIVNPHELYKFLKTITQKLVYSSLELANKTARTGLESEGYIILNGIYLPMVFSIGFNKAHQRVGVCSIKTFMPEHYDSAIRNLKKTKPLKPSENFFDYQELFVILDE